MTERSFFFFYKGTGGRWRKADKRSRPYREGFSERTGTVEGGSRAEKAERSRSSTEQEHRVAVLLLPRSSASATLGKSRERAIVSGLPPPLFFFFLTNKKYFCLKSIFTFVLFFFSALRLGTVPYYTKRFFPLSLALGDWLLLDRRRCAGRLRDASFPIGVGGFEGRGDWLPGGSQRKAVSDSEMQFHPEGEISHFSSLLTAYCTNTLIH